MKIVIECPQCKVKLKVDERLEGKTVGCPQCKERFAASRLVAASPAPDAVEPGFPFDESTTGKATSGDDSFGQNFSVGDAADANSFPVEKQPTPSPPVATPGVSISYRFREVIKGICLLFIVVAFGGGLLAWFAVDRPDSTTWLLRWLAIGVGTVSLGGFLFVHFQKSQAPDYLGTFFDQYFDCEGLGFTIDTEKRNDRCYFRVVFQNRHSNPCLARMILRPTRKLFGKQDETAITLEMACPGGSFGVTSVPIPIQDEWVGTKQSFDLIAGVKYPDGRGATLHYGEGTAFLRSRASFENAFESTLTTVALLGGSILSFKPASIELRVPYGVESGFAASSSPRTQILWTFGEPCLHEDEVISRLGLEPV